MDKHEWTQRYCTDEPLAPWERELLGYNSTVAVFTMDGRSETFDGVQVDTITVRTIGSIGGFKVLSFKTLDFRTVNVLDVSYWTVDEK